MALQQILLVAASPQQTVRPRIQLSGLLVHAPREHTRTSAGCSRRRLLLPLCGIAPAWWLCEDVRFEAVRPTLAGNEMREASYADANP